MKRLTAAGIAIIVLLALAVPALAAPAAQGVLVVITSPAMNAVVRGTVLIQGSASHPNFWKYEVHMAPEPNPSNQWSVLGIHENAVINGNLETWDTATVPDGSYSLLLRVVDRTGNYQEYFVRQISVSNTSPTETPMPTATRAPTQTPLPRATPTVLVIEQPTMDIAPATPTPTLARPTRAPAVSVPTLDLDAWKDAFLLGAGAMGAIFLLLGLIYLIRRIL